ncbi:MAG: glycoside hydrolase family 26 protein, partial [Alphaproteobacteria bacterium]
RKIPSIPPPKDDAVTDAWRLAVPNLVAALVSAAAAIYGLLGQHHEFTLVMAALALVNAAQLTGVAMMGQQRTMRRLRAAVSRQPAVAAVAAGLSAAAAGARRLYAGMLGGMREGAVAAALAAMVAVVALHAVDQETMAQDKRAAATMARDGRSFLLGMYHPEHDRGRPTTMLAQVERRLGVDMRLISTYQAWGPQSLASFPEPLLRDAWARGGVPLIVWEPWVQDLPAAQADPNLANNRRVLSAIADGTFDDYILAYAVRLRDLGGPVMLSFAHEADNDAYHWARAGGNSAADFVAAWRHVVTLFRAVGATNVVWVYHPWSPEAVAAYYPGAAYVDWVALTMLNYGRAARDGTWHSFSALYEAYRRQVVALDKPVLLAEFGTTAYGGDPAQWIASALDSIAAAYPEIRGLSFFHSKDDRNWPTDWRPEGQLAQAIDWTSGYAADVVAPIVAALDQRPFEGTGTASNQQAAARGR